jgi:pyruvate dehydrogenase E2 component (dihydrolipoamide acetyltransferase)
MNDIVMPKLSDTMTEGRLVSWKKRVGEAVRRGEVLAEVETDKANMELEAFVSGVLLEIRVQAGEMVQVGTVIGVIGKAEEKGAEAAKPAAAAEPEAGPAAAAAAEPAANEPTPAAAKEEPATAKEEPAQAAPQVRASENQAPAAPVAPGADDAKAADKALSQAPATEEAKAVAAASGKGEAGGEAQAPLESHERAAPMVRRRARELGIDLASVKGSGPEGRILLQDLEAGGTAPAETRQAAEPEAKPVAPGGESAGPDVQQPSEASPQPLSRLRAAIAKTVSESWRNIPHFDVTMDLFMDEAEEVRRQMKQGGVAVTLTDLVVKGVALSLQKFPLLNASFSGNGLQMHERINIGVAVAVPDGVLIPVINDCSRLSVMEIADASRALAERARSGALSEQEMSGGTFSVSNLGMYGVSQFRAIIYPTHAAVLAVGALAEVVILRAGVAAITKVMKVTLSADHRVVDGAYAAQFLAELKGILENPVRLII